MRRRWPAARFPQPFAVGMRQAGVLATWATDWLGPANVRCFKVQRGGLVV